jgi:ethanolamine utilization protein EutA
MTVQGGQAGPDLTEHREHQHPPVQAGDSAHEGFEVHGHLHEEDLEALREQDTEIDAVSIAAPNPGWMVLNSVGIDIGSSTSHLTFSRLYLERQGMAMSSRFVTVRRDVLHRSPILLTPYVDIDTIDVERLSKFVLDSYAGAGVEPADIHTGAVICTGEAVKKRNSEAITRLFSRVGGAFVCATAGPRLEAILAANGSGSVALSRSGSTVLNIDIGGGTTKVTISQNGTILETGAISLGARLMAWDPATGGLNRVETTGRRIAEQAGLRPEIGDVLSAEEKRRFVRLLVDLLLSYLRREDRVPPGLLITGPLIYEDKVDAVVFSGGVAEYIYGHESLEFGDFGPMIGEEVRKRLAWFPAPVAEGSDAIRATVIGASQYTVQVSSSTIFVSDENVLPLRDYQVVVPRFSGRESTQVHVAEAIDQAMARYDLLDGESRHAVALCLQWPHETSYASLTLLASGVSSALSAQSDGRPWVLIFDRDIGALVGAVLKEDLGVANEVVAVDEIEATDLDFVDVGQPLGNRSAVPVVVKTLIFE